MIRFSKTSLKKQVKILPSFNLLFHFSCCGDTLGSSFRQLVAYTSMGKASLLCNLGNTSLMTLLSQSLVIRSYWMEDEVHFMIDLLTGWLFLSQIHPSFITYSLKNTQMMTVHTVRSRLGLYRPHCLHSSFMTSVSLIQDEGLSLTNHRWYKR